MKRFIFIFTTLFLLSLSFKPISAFSQPTTKTLKQGVYNARDTNLLIGSSLTVRLDSSNNKAIILVIDSDHTIESLVRLNPRVTQQVLPPLNYDSSIIIFSTSNVVFE